MSIQTFNISLPRELMKKADQIAKAEYRSRSELIRDLLRNYVNEKEEWRELFAYGKRIGKKMGIKSEEDVYKMMYEIRHGKQST